MIFARANPIDGILRKKLWPFLETIGINDLDILGQEGLDPQSHDQVAGQREYTHFF